jgi:hypothetical protein
MRRVVDAVRARWAAASANPSQPQADPAPASAAPPADTAAPPPVNLLEILNGIRALFDGQMAPVTLEPKDRQRFGGMIFLGADLFVRGVAQALTERPDLFNVPGLSGPALAQKQKRARAWFLIRAALLRMAQDAGDSFLYEHGTAIEAAYRVIHTVKNEAEAAALRGDEGPNVRHMEQLDALFPALWVLDKRAEQKQRARRKAEKQIAEALKPPAQKAQEEKEQNLRQAYQVWRKRHAERVKKGLVPR